MAPVLEDDPAFDREGGERPPHKDDTVKAPADGDTIGEDSPPADEEGTVLNEEETSEQQQEKETDNVGGGAKEIDESVAESIAQPQVENVAPDTEEQEEVEGPEVTSDRNFSTLPKELIGSVFDRASSLVANAYAFTRNKQEESPGDDDEDVQSVMHAATPWVQVAVENLQGFGKGVAQTTDAAVRSACNQLGELQDSTTTNFYLAQDSYWRWKHNFGQYEDGFFNHVKDGIKKAADRPVLSTVVGIGAALALFRRPRRFLFRQTIGRFRSEEAMLAREKAYIQEKSQILGLQKQDMRKLEDRYNRAETEYLSGRSKLENTGVQFRSLIRHLYKSERHLEGSLERLRYYRGKEAVRMRAEVAAMAAEVKRDRDSLDNKLYTIASYDIKA